MLVSYKTYDRGRWLGWALRGKDYTALTKQSKWHAIRWLVRLTVSGIRGWGIHPIEYHNCFLLFLVSRVTDTCFLCSLVKHTRTPFPLSSISSQFPFELIHIDIWGGYHELSLSGAQYFLTIVDDFTRSTWVYLMIHKSEARQLLTNFIKLIETQYDTHVKIVRSDNGPEFQIPSFYSSKGIIHQTSCVNTP